MSTIEINDINWLETLSDDDATAVKGGFWFLTGCIKPLPMELGEECNNGICVPYQDENGDY